MTSRPKGPSRPKSAAVVPLRPRAESAPLAIETMIRQLGEELAELRSDVKALRRELARRPTVTPAAPDAGLLYGISAIAKHLGISTRQAKHRIATGHIPSFRLGDSVCARRSDLDAWLAGLASGGQG